jgi:hypothetical protein
MLDLRSRLQSTVFTIEASEYEEASLKKEWGEVISWVDGEPQHFLEIGKVSNKLVCIKVHWVLLNDRRVMFWRPSSLVVDHTMIETWMDRNCSEIKLYRVKRCNAQSFRICLSAIKTRKCEKEILVNNQSVLLQPPVSNLGYSAS